MGLAAIDELGFPNVTTDAIVGTRSLMTLFKLKVESTREVFADIWYAPHRERARQHLEWIGQYNLYKASTAVNAFSLHVNTNAPSLYTSTDPETTEVDYIPGLKIASRNPQYTIDFVGKYHHLALACANSGMFQNYLGLDNPHTNGEMSGEELPWGQPLCELYEMSYHASSAPVCLCFRLSE